MRKISIITLLVMAAACGHKHEAVQPPMMGWASWNAFMIDISDTLIMQQADLLKSTGLADAGYTYVNIDDGHFGFRDAEGYMTPNDIRFPGGLRQVADHIHSLGLKAGIYSDAGDNTCGSSWNKDIYGMGAGLWGHEIQDAQTYFNDWDFDFIKIDFCGGKHLQLPEKERYLRIREVVDSVSDHPVKINICRWHYPGTWAPEAGDSWRISGDIYPEWKSVVYVMNKNMYLSAYTGNGKYNDMDMLVVGYGNKRSGLTRGTGLTFQEEEAHFGLWCFMSSPLMLGCDLDYLPEDTRQLVTNPELIAINQDRLGIQPQVVQFDGVGYVLVKDLKIHRGKERAVALYNPSDEEHHFECPLELLAFEGEVKLRDAIRRESLGKVDCISMDLPAHSARILTIKGNAGIEQKRYEAEWGYIPAYNDIGKGGAKYVPTPGASCGAVVSGLGGSEENRPEIEVHRFEGGKWRSKLIYASEEACALMVDVNGNTQTLELPATDGFASVPLVLKLHQGCNKVCLSSPEKEIPALIDAIELFQSR